jgi:hypothetical protein
MSSINEPSGADTRGPGASSVKVVASDAKHRIEEGAEAVLDKTKGVAGDLQNEAGKIAGEALESAKSYAEANKGKVAGQIDSLASALNKAADELESGEQAQFAGYARQLAGGVNGFSSAIRDKGVEELLGMVGNFARSNTAAFIGGAALLGFAASRFAMAGIKSAATSAQTPEPYPDYSTTEHSGMPLSGEPVVSEPWHASGGSAPKPAGTADSSGGSI